MKYSKAEVHRKTHSLPALRFEDSQLTSFSVLILIQALFTHLELKERLRRCFSHLTVSPMWPPRGLAVADAESVRRLQGLVRVLHYIEALQGA